MPQQNYVPFREVISLARQGYNDATIVKQLREAGFSSRQINDAFNQAKIKAAAGDAEEEQMEPSIMTPQYAEQDEQAPAPGQYGYGAEMPMGRQEEQVPEEGGYPSELQFPSVEAKPSTEVIEEIAEEIINEKWQDFKTKVGDFGMLRKYFEDKLNSLALRTKKLETMSDRIQTAVEARIRTYDSELKTLRAELQALETAFSKILEPLVSGVRKIEQGAPISRETRAEAEKEFTRLKKRTADDKLEARLKGKKR